VNKGTHGCPLSFPFLGIQKELLLALLAITQAIDLWGQDEKSGYKSGYEIDFNITMFICHNGFGGFRRLLQQIGVEADADGTPMAAVDHDGHRQVVEDFAGVADISLEQRRLFVLGQLDADRVVEDALVPALG
jgi:hypothetical protein